MRCVIDKKITILLVLVTLLTSLSGCAHKPMTVVPHTIFSSAPSFDGSHADSGLIGTTGEQFIITVYALNRYLNLVDQYGSDPEFLVPLDPEKGIKNAPDDLVAKYNRGKLFLMDAEAMTNFIVMRKWQRQSRPLPKHK